MGLTVNLFKAFCNDTILLLDTALTKDSYCPIDLSVDNIELNNFDIQNPTQCQKYISGILERNNAQIAYGGYLEKRNLYGDKSNFSKKGAERNIHLGIDFWTKAGTEVITPLDGLVHSFQNNATVGDYGPTIILKHRIEAFEFHTLYGHLSMASIKNLRIGQEFRAGEVLATLGTPDINVNYAPHLHFQIIVDIQGMFGDYPGVCSESRLDFYVKNCPNPNLLLQL
jgi:murein DD-endopeptidase MepM/ murein hydrolase activator NlpD